MSSSQALASQCSVVALSLDDPRSKNVVSWNQSPTILGHTHGRHGCNSSSHASPCGLGNVDSALRRFRARFSRASPPVCWQVGPWPFLDRPLSLESRPSRVGSSAWFLSCAFWMCLQPAGVHLGSRLRWLGPVLLARYPSHFP